MHGLYSYEYGAIKGGVALVGDLYYCQLSFSRAVAGSSPAAWTPIRVRTINNMYVPGRGLLSRLGPRLTLLLVRYEEYEYFQVGRLLALCFNVLMVPMAKWPFSSQLNSRLVGPCVALPGTSSVRRRVFFYGNPGMHGQSDA